MRLLSVVPSYYPALKHGGPIKSVHELNKALVGKGISVDVITTNAGLEGREDPVGEWVPLDGIRVKYHPYYFHERYTFSPALLRDLLRSAGGYDLLHVAPLWNFPVLAGSMAAVYRGKPYIISPRGTVYEETVNIKSKKKKLLYYNLIARHYLRGAAAVHFTTEDEREKVTEYLHLKGRAFVVPNGFDLAEFGLLPRVEPFAKRYPELLGKRYVLFLGRLNMKKGLDILVDAFRDIARSYPDLRLVIAGPDDEGYGDKVRGRLDSYGILDRALFTGMLFGEEKLSAFRDAEVFVLASYSENFGMAVIEAMACGTPVIISNKVGIHREVGQNNAGVVVDTEAEDVSSGIRLLLDNAAFRRELGENGRRMVVEYYDIEKVASMMAERYSETIAGER